ncbi:MAG: hypothetical protein AB1631_28960 [Acidobacteriota bacterium]
MSLLKQVLDIVALRYETDATRLASEPKGESRAARSSQRAWVVEISLAALEEKAREELSAAMIYEIGKSIGDEWKLIAQKRCEVRGDAEEFCRRFLAMMTQLGMKQGDSIILLADERHSIDQAMRAAAGETLSPQAISATGVVLPPPQGDHLSAAEQSEIEQVIAVIRREKIVEYLRKHLT